ncbi:MAG: GspH/FimT family pseudopilin, partial [Pseudomonadota bacterium]|nr:GspH/FimT family pseudopilin [Pseudomonadota bacterium]
MKTRNMPERGFTLIEAMIVIAVLTVVVAATTVSLSDLSRRQASRAEINGIFRTFQVARATAINHGQIVTICPLTDTGDCGSDWNTPVSVFLDPQNKRQLRQPKDVVHRFYPSQYGVFAAAPSNRRYFQFSPIGSSRGTLGNVTWCAREDDPTLRQQLILSRSGRVRWAQDNDGDGVKEKYDGTPIA